ncbi:MAG: carbohydrate-binding family 9-like protein [Acidobacteria bacterium]|nr:carbohydrate-binding family 9-like protein [Acidobacteriota bacterium]
MLLLAAAPAVQGPANGTLVIIGGGKIGPEITSRMIELAGGLDAPWVVIPTAGDPDTYDAKTVENSLFSKAGVKNVTVLHTRDPKVADTDEFVAPIKKARGVFFPGGRQWRLVDSYLGTKTQREIEAVLARGGVVGGTSAGATILGSYLVRGARSGNTIMMAPGYEEGFGLVKPMAIDQHLLVRKREHDMWPVIEKHPELLGVGLDESTAIVVKANAFEVIGPSKVAIYETGKSMYFLAAGDKFDLTRRVALPAAQAPLGRTIPPLPKYEVKRAASRIVVDGKLDDAAWAAAAPVHFIFPWEFQKGAKQKTTARLLWDDENLYVGYDAVDSDIVAHYDKRDDPTYKDDALEIFINPDRTQTNYYGLEMNAKATLYDYFYIFPTLLLKRLDFTGVQLATHLRGTLNQTSDTDQGWTLEAAIPWSNFEELAKKLPPEPGTSWWINMNRWDGTEPNRRLSQWSDSGLPQAHPHNPARFGQIVFVK